MHLGWMVRHNGYVYETCARKGGIQSIYAVYLRPCFEDSETKGIVVDKDKAEIVVGYIQHGYKKRWNMVGSHGEYPGIQGFIAGRFAAFHLLKVRGYMDWEAHC